MKLTFGEVRRKSGWRITYVGSGCLVAIDVVLELQIFAEGTSGSIKIDYQIQHAKSAA